MSSAGQDAVDLAAESGVFLDDWQRYCLEISLGLRPDGRWASLEVAGLVSRQNGKGQIILARELAGLFLFGEELQLHSAHEYKTANEAFLRIKDVIEGTPFLLERVAQIRTGSNDVAVVLKNGARLKFVARSKGSGRGFSADLVILDEAYNLPPQMVAAMLPTLSARPNPQIWYLSSAPMSDLESVTLRKLRGRGHAADGENRFTFFEWAIDEADVLRADQEIDPARVVELVRASNPALGIRLDLDFILETELRSMDVAEFNRERLGVPDPDPFEAAEKVIDMAAWAGRADHRAQPAGRVVVGVAVSPDRRWSAVGLAGRREGGGWLGVNVDHREGTHWVAARVAGLVAERDVAEVVLDERGPAGSMVAELAEAGVPAGMIHSETTKGYSAACGLLHDLVTADDGDGFWHRNQLELTDQLASAGRRWLSDAWLWRRTETGDITILEAVTLALGRAVGMGEAKPQPRVIAFST